MLTLKLVCVGRLKAGAERELCLRYLDRARASGRALGLDVLLREVLESRAREPAARERAEADAIRAAMAPDQATTLAFDERGTSIGSEELARIVRSALERGIKTLNFVIGGPDGLDPDLRNEAAHVVALGAMTWPHQLARIMVAEQIYRAITILGGHPYHRA